MRLMVNLVPHPAAIGDTPSRPSTVDTRTTTEK